MKQNIINKTRFSYLLMFIIALVIFIFNIGVNADDNVEYCDESCFNVSSKTQIREEVIPPAVFYTSTYEGIGGKNIEFLEVANKLYSTKFAVEDSDISNKEVYLNKEKLEEKIDFIYRVEDIDGGIKISYTFTETGLSKLTDNWIIEVKGKYKPKMGETTFIGCHKIYGIKEKETQEIEPESPLINENVECEQDYKVIVPAESDSIKYEVTITGKIVVVKAIAKDGYAFKPGTKTEWTFDITNNEKCPIVVTPEKPNIIDPSKPGIPDVPEVEENGVIVPSPDYELGCYELDIKVPTNTKAITYTKEAIDGYIVVRAVANNGYVIKDGSVVEWKFKLPDTPEHCFIDLVTPEINKNVECYEDYKLLIPGYEGVPEIEGLEYLIVMSGNKVKVIVKVKDGYIIKQRAQITEWEFDTTNDEECIVKITPIAPSLDKDVECEQDYKLVTPDDTEQIHYEVTWNNKVATIEAKAKEGCEIEEGMQSVWILDTNNTELCDSGNVVTPEKPGDNNGNSKLPDTGDSSIYYMIISTIIGLSLSTILLYKRFSNTCEIK